MKARVEATFECEAELLTRMTGGGEGVQCAATAPGYLKMCIGSVLEGGLIPEETKVFQPISVGVGPEAAKAGWEMYSEGGSILLVCPDHKGLVDLRRVQAAKEKEKADGDGDEGGSAGG